MAIAVQPHSLFRAHQSLRNVVSLGFDLAAAAAAFAGAYLTLYGYPAALRVPGIEEKLLGFVAVSLAAFLVFAPYRGSWRYASVPDMLAIVRGAVAAVAVYTLAAFLLTRGENVPRSVPVLTLIYLVLAMAGARLAYRIAQERLSRLGGQPRAAGRSAPTVLLCGFSDRAESFIRAARRSRAFSIAGIVDDSRINLGRTIQGVRVLGDLDQLEEVLGGLERDGHVVAELVVTEVSPSRQRLADIVGRGKACSIRVSRIPDLTEMLSAAGGGLLEPRPIELSDLLKRPEQNTDINDFAGLIEGKAVLATGAGGTIGSELCRQVATLRPARLVITDTSEFLLYRLDGELRERHPDIDIVTRIVDVRDARRVSATLAQTRPEVVFHAAALKHVSLAEANPLEAIKTNVLGTRNVAAAAREAATSVFIMISTDKAVNPTSIMGATKRVAEAYCQALDMLPGRTRFKTVRFGNVLGSNGSVVPRFQQQIAAGGPVTVTHPRIVRYFMTIPEAVRLILHACAHRLDRGKILVLDMGEPVRIVDLAERMIELAGYRPRVDIDIVFTGLQPGEKLREELFDPSEVSPGSAGEGYVVAAPRVIDRQLLERIMTEIHICAEREDAARAIELLAHVVPEYRKAAAGAPAVAGHAEPS